MPRRVGMNETVETRQKRLRFRSWHRGTRELDLLLGRFADQHLGDLTTEQLDRFEAIIESSDPDIYGWVSGSEAPPTAHDTDVLKMIKNTKKKV
jgi:antitoxin CptB